MINDQIKVINCFASCQTLEKLKNENSLTIPESVILMVIEIENSIWLILIFSPQLSLPPRLALLPATWDHHGLKRMSLVGDALSHVALPGMAVALALGYSPILGAFIALSLAIAAFVPGKKFPGFYPETLVGIAFTAFFGHWSSWITRSRIFWRRFLAASFLSSILETFYLPRVKRIRPLKPIKKRLRWVKEYSSESKNHWSYLNDKSMKMPQRWLRKF